MLNFLKLFLLLNDAPPTVDNQTAIEVKGVAIDDVDEVCGQLDNGVDATITTLLVYFHDYKAYSCKFSCPVKLTCVVCSNNIYPLG